ncbi:hypothetical protein DMA11_09480 [Marinilabiliaceae bacterium JC017]|nr:hypothetical protein DMA11_09480 [Marinilabiliaceae bacterium JC017]
MKRLLLGIVFVLGLSFASMAQSSDRNIGLRLGGGHGFGAEISYQQPFEYNRIEVDLGWGSSSHWNGWGLTGLYQWVMPIESGFNWYLGVGPSLGYWSEKDEDKDIDDQGMYLAAAGDIGIEYNFTEIPIQISLDARPELGLINRWDAFDMSLGFSIRYRF